MTIRIMLLGLLLTAAAGCRKDDEGGVTLTSDKITELYPVTNHSKEIKFRADGSWKASCSAAWLTFSPKSGDEGSQTITVSTTSTNRTRNVRTAQLTITSGGTSQTVTVKQRGEYAVFEQDVYEVAAEGGGLTMKLTSNLGEGKLFWGWSTDLEDMIPELKEMREESNGARTRSADDIGIMAGGVVGGTGRNTRADNAFTLGPLQVEPNDSRNRRSGYIFLTMQGDGDDVLMLDTVTVTQAGRYDGYVSTDYSQDGRVDILNRASLGQGIPVVLMGDGFQDREIADGTYAEVMNQAMENLFSEEPIRSLRDYFTVYQVTAVSRHNLFGSDYSTALSTEPDAGASSGIDVDAGAVMRYVKQVEGIDSIHTLAVVILNTNQHKGVTYMMGDPKRTDYSYSIALCPVIDSLQSETFRQVLTHEAIGHGFAKLADEYVRSVEGSATDDDIKTLKEIQDTYGWYLNVDSEKDSTKVLWTRFIFDDLYAAEKIGTYEGGYTYFKGVYRPSEESMMRSNDAPFNAPSRQVIYNKVMKMALGKSPDYAEFVAFDREHQPSVWSYRARTRQGGGVPWRPEQPRVVWRMW